MFGSRLNAFRLSHLFPPHHPPHCLPAYPEPRRERNEVSAFLHTFLSMPSSHAAQAVHPFSTATLLRTRRNTHNSNPLMRSLHNSRIPRVGGSVRAAFPSFSRRHGRVSVVLRGLAYSLERLTSSLGQPLIASISFRIRTHAKHVRNPFRIRTSKTQHLKSFRIRTYRKNRGGVPPFPRFSTLPTRHPLVVC